MRVKALSKQRILTFPLPFNLDPIAISVRVHTFLPLRTYIGGTEVAVTGAYRVGGLPDLTETQCVGYIRVVALDGTSKTFYMNNTVASIPAWSTPTTVPVYRYTEIAAADLATIINPRLMEVVIESMDGFVEIPDGPPSTHSYNLTDGSNVAMYLPSMLLDCSTPTTFHLLGGGVRGAKWCDFEENIYNANAERK